MKRPDPYLRLVPWRILAVFDPIERVLHRLEADGTVDSAGAQIVFNEPGRGGWYDLPAAISGVVEFHELAARRHGLPVDVEALKRFANKLQLGSPVFEKDLIDVRSSISSCKQQAMKLRVSEAESIVRTVQISMEMEKLKRKAA